MSSVIAFISRQRMREKNEKKEKKGYLDAK